MSVERGSVYWVELDPVRGSEMAKTRPCVVVSATPFNDVRRTVVIVPLTSTTAPPNWPLLVALPSFSPQTRVRTEQVRVVDKSRLRQRIDTLDPEAQQQLDAALRETLGLG
jgi:mRNA interferase MazF